MKKILLGWHLSGRKEKAKQISSILFKCLGSFFSFYKKTKLPPMRPWEHIPTLRTLHQFLGLSSESWRSRRSPRWFLQAGSPLWVLFCNTAESLNTSYESNHEAKFLRTHLVRKSFIVCRDKNQINHLMAETSMVNVKHWIIILVAAFKVIINIWSILFHFVLPEMLLQPYWWRKYFHYALREKIILLFTQDAISLLLWNPARKWECCIRILL